MSLLSMISALVQPYNATVEGEDVRVTDAKSGSSVLRIQAGPGVSHAIAIGNKISVYYRKGGIKVYTKGGSLVSFTGNCN